MTTMPSAAPDALRRGFLIVAAAAGLALARISDAAVEIPANWPTATLTNADALAVDESQFLPVEQFEDWNAEMEGIGPANQQGLRATGSPEHEHYIDLLREDLRQAGVRAHVEKIEMRRWSADQWSLDLTDGPNAGAVPTSSYIPYSGQTDADGVTGPLVFSETPNAIAPNSMVGKIVVFEVPLQIVPLAFFTAFGYPDRVHDPGASLNPSDPYKRPYLNQIIPVLDRLRSSGAIGAVAILDWPADGAAGSYFPYDGSIRTVPGLYVDRGTGAALKAEALAGHSATLRLPATIETVETRNLVAKIKGRNKKEWILLHSHTDGTNAVEDNGPGSIVAIAQYLKRLPKDSLDRGVMILLSSGHFAGGIGAQTFIEKHRKNYVRQINAAITIEHLGTLEWDEQPGGFMGPTGRYEPSAFFSPGSTPLVDAAYDWFLRSDAAPGGVLKPIDANAVGFANSAAWPGEGQYLFARGDIQDANYITGPTYLLNWGITTADKVDFARIREETIGFAEMTMQLTRTSGEALRTTDLCHLLFCDDAGNGTGTDVASSSLAGADIASVVDGDAASFWQSGSAPGTSDWVEIDRGASKTVTSVDLYMTSPSAPGDRIEEGVVETSNDDSTWTSLGAFSATDEVHLTAPGLMARYVRVRPTAAQAGTMVIREFAVDRQLASSSLGTTSGNAVGSMTDSDAYASSWRSSAAPSTADWVELDLGTPHVVTDIDLRMADASSPGDRIGQGTIEGSLDRLAWTPVGDFSGTNDVRLTAPPGTTARYIRARTTAAQAERIVVREFSAITLPLQPSSGPGGSVYPYGDMTVSSGGTAENAWYVFEPANPKPVSAPVAIILHGYAEYAGYETMLELIRHTVRKGNVVVYPRWQTSLTTPCSGSSDIYQCEASAVTGIQDAIAWLQANPARVQPQLDKASYFGFSFGGILTANLANRYSTLGIPEPKAIFLDDPHDGGFGGSGEPGLDDTLSGIPATVKLQCHVGANGVISEAGKENDSCNAIFPRINHVADKDLVLSYTDTHGDPDLLSDHGVSMGYEGTADAYDWNFVWKVWDALRNWAYDGTDSQYAHGDTPEHRDMGTWGDGVAITPLKIQDTAPIAP